MDERKRPENEELRDIQTHTAGATDIHETHHHKKRTIDAPTSSPGPYGPFDEEDTDDSPS